MLIFITAIVGVYYAKYEGLNTLRSGFIQLSKNQTPAYEVVSGAAIAIAAVLLIIPGFATDIFGFLLIFPLSRKFIFSKFKSKIKKKENLKKDHSYTQNVQIYFINSFTNFQIYIYQKMLVNLGFWTEKLLM